jgi:glycosyltransferase involved in cell wall biosynthesis
MSRSYLLRECAQPQKEDHRGNSRAEMIRVLQIPGDHPYVEHCAGDIAGTRIVRAEGMPHPALDPQWLESHHDDFDVVHLHFGFEHLDVDRLRRWVGLLERYRIPLIYTVHDLRNPHQLSALPHDRHLDVLIRSAAALFTLTSGAAQEIERRWDRMAFVVAHPYVVDPQDRPGRPPSRRTAGIHLKDLRRNIVQPDRVIAAATEGARAAGGRMRIDLHPGALADPELAGTRALAAAGRLDLAVHGRFSDRELAEYLSGLDVFVLPYRFGTHSGWLEACRDVGTRVVVPSCGYYADQWDETLTYRHDESAGLDEASLSEAVRQALLRPPLAPADATLRQAQREHVRAEHARVYADLARRARVAS